MSIELTDIPAAVANYLDTNVSTTISAITPEDPDQDVLTPGQNAKFTVTVTNAAAPDGVRLSNVQHHVKISDANVAQLIVPTSLVLAFFDNLSTTSPLKPGTARTELFVRNEIDPTIDVGGHASFTLELECLDQGAAKATSHVHADIAESDLFPLSQSPNGVQTLTVA